MNDIERQIEYGIDEIDERRTVEVNLKDLIYVYQTMQELVSFFHNPIHYPTMEEIERFLGTKEEGGFKCISDSVYHKMRDMMPEDIDEKYDEGDFDCPDLPFYKRLHDAD